MSPGRENRTDTTLGDAFRIQRIILVFRSFKIGGGWILDISVPRDRLSFYQKLANESDRACYVLTAIAPMGNVYTIFYCLTLRNTQYLFIFYAAEYNTLSYEIYDYTVAS